MYSYQDYYDALSTAETGDIVEPNYNLTYYCKIGVFDDLPKIIMHVGLVPISIGARKQAPITTENGKKKINFYYIYTLDGVIENLDYFIQDGLAAVKITPFTLVLASKHKFLIATDIQICSIDKTFDKNIFLIESFCRTAIRKNIHSFRHVKNITAEMIKHILYRNSPDGKRFIKEVAKIMAKYKL